MKKTTKAALIVSVILLLTGGALIFYALWRADLDWDKMTIISENETYDYTVTDNIQNVKIKTKQADVRVVRSPSTAFSVRAKVSSRDACAVETNDGVLTVTCSDNPSTNWYQQIWRRDDLTVTVFLPLDSYEYLDLNTGSGDMYVSDDLSFTNARTKSGSGELEFYAPVTEDLSVNSGSGDVTVKRTGCKTLSAETDSGSVEFDNCRNDVLSVTTASGDVVLSNCNVKTMLTNTASGDLAFAKVAVSELLRATSSSGDISFTDSSAADMQITAKSGDVTGKLIGPMLFDVRSDSGDVVLPPSGGTSRCTIRTGSGDVHFFYNEE